jgi:hypothetical protein
MGADGVPEQSCARLISQRLEVRQLCFRCTLENGWLTPAVQDLRREWKRTTPDYFFCSLAGTRLPLKWYGMVRHSAARCDRSSVRHRTRMPAVYRNVGRAWRMLRQTRIRGFRERRIDIIETFSLEAEEKRLLCGVCSQNYLWRCIQWLRVGKVQAACKKHVLETALQREILQDSRR